MCLTNEIPKRVVSEQNLTHVELSNVYSTIRSNFSKVKEGPIMVEITQEVNGREEDIITVIAKEWGPLSNGGIQAL